MALATSSHEARVVNAHASMLLFTEAATPWVAVDMLEVLSRECGSSGSASASCKAIATDVLRWGVDAAQAAFRPELAADLCQTFGSYVSAGAYVRALQCMDLLFTLKPDRGNKALDAAANAFASMTDDELISLAEIVSQHIQPEREGTAARLTALFRFARGQWARLRIAQLRTSMTRARNSQEWSAKVVAIMREAPDGSVLRVSAPDELARLEDMGIYDIREHDQTWATALRPNVSLTDALRLSRQLEADALSIHTGSAALHYYRILHDAYVMARVRHMISTELTPDIAQLSERALFVLTLSRRAWVADDAFNSPKVIAEVREMRRFFAQPWCFSDVAEMRFGATRFVGLAPRGDYMLACAGVAP